jgi:ribonucleoside-diphosphate reductase alpha chain
MNDTIYETFIAKSRYARYLESEARRENWSETVARYFAFMQHHLLEKHAYEIPEELFTQLKEAVTTKQVLPSMRALMTAGEALSRNNTAGYNCSYLPVDDPKSFDEAMFILLCGTGVGFSVERQYINKLPEIPERIYDSESCIVVSDSKEGWAKALRQVIALLYSGECPRWDVSKVRPAGARLKTFGGRASGPEPLVDLFKFVIRIFKAAQGRKLNSIECHDIMCKIGEVVVVGGVRRSAMISLSNLSDERMRHAKSGAWWESNPQRALANNSICFTERPEVGIFMQEWLSLYESKSGERGIFNREAAVNIAKKNGRRNIEQDFGTNPCSEIILRPYQFCNLSTVIVRAEDSVEDLIRKARLAAVLGTFQSTLTHFPYLRKIWR